MGSEAGALDPEGAGEGLRALGSGQGLLMGWRFGPKRLGEGSQHLCHCETEEVRFGVKVSVLLWLCCVRRVLATAQVNKRRKRSRVPEAGGDVRWG